MPTKQELIQLEYDKKQMQFATDGTLIINQRLINEQTPLIALINEKNFWICPFCLETSNKFIIKNKGLIECSNCLIDMRIKTLLFVKDCTNQEYAKWVFDYRLSGFFTKLKSGNNSFEKWNQKLKDLGISYEFWKEYKKLKGEYEAEKDPEKYSTETINTFIGILVRKIKEGMTKEQIYSELYDVEVEDSLVDYCYNEALLNVNREMKK